MIEGQCACGAITVRVRAIDGTVTNCHCGQCRKQCGGAYLTVVPVNCDDFVLSDPGNQLANYRATAAKERAFCSICGGMIYSRRAGSNSVRVRAGLFDDLDGRKPEVHIFADSPALWYRSRDQLPRYSATEPGRS
ncbi:MAG: GFA family protein [Gammaproteobacteria bacterium]